MPEQPTSQGLLAKEMAHQAAATFAAGVMSAFQLSLASADPTFKDQALNNVILVGWGAWKIAYAGIISALKDASWGDPSPSQPNQPPAQPVVQPSPAPASPSAGPPKLS